MAQVNPNSVEQTRASSCRLTFLDLPKEIRDHIYGYILSHQFNIFLLVLAPRSQPNADQVWLQHRTSSDVHGKATRTPGLQISHILRASHAIYNDFATYFYNSTTFEFFYRRYQYDAFQSATLLPPIHSIRHVRLGSDLTEAYFLALGESHKHHRLLCRRLFACQSLQHVEFMTSASTLLVRILQCIASSPELRFESPRMLLKFRQRDQTSDPPSTLVEEFLEALRCDRYASPSYIGELPRVQEVLVSGLVSPWECALLERADFSGWKLSLLQEDTAVNDTAKHYEFQMLR